VTRLLDSKRVRVVLIVGLFALLLGSQIKDWRQDRAAGRQVRRDIAAVEVAGGQLTYDEVSGAWTDLQAGRLSAMAALRDPVGVPGFTTYEDEGAIILVFQSVGRCKIDLLVRPKVNTVRTRDC
jgi:hypothetical protein